MNGNQSEATVASFEVSSFPGPLELVAVLGFMMVGASTFLDFTPVIAQNWRASGVGLPVLIACLAGALVMLRKNHFAGFFIAMFAAFFLTHEIIIVYDNKAVELGRELGPDGWFRPVVMIYRDAFSFKTGAFWALAGTLLSLSGICIGWFQEVRRANKAAGAAFNDKTPENAVIAETAAFEFSEPAEELEEEDSDLDAIEEAYRNDESDDENA